MSDRAQNPAWSNKLMAANWDRIQKYAQAHKLPMPERAKVFHELGCGNYGCVLPTTSDAIVLKITSDPTEAAIYRAVQSIGADIAPDGILKDFGLVELEGKFRKRGTFAIWKERAVRVGGVFSDKTLDKANSRLLTFKTLASMVRASDMRRPGSVAGVEAMEDWGAFSEQLLRRRYMGEPQIVDNAKSRKGELRVRYALAACKYVAEIMSNEPEFNLIGEALLWFMHYGILLADVHSNNVGEVLRSENYNEPVWVITDPGHAVPIAPTWSYVVTDELPRRSVLLDREKNPTKRTGSMSTKKIKVSPTSYIAAIDQYYAWFGDDVPATLFSFNKQPYVLINFGKAGRVYTAQTFMKAIAAAKKAEKAKPGWGASEDAFPAALRGKHVTTPTVVGAAPTLTADGKIKYKLMTDPALAFEGAERFGRFENPTYHDRLVKHYGTTDDPKLGAFLLPNGSFLDFSEGSGSRSQDHRNITWASTVAEKPREARWDVMVRVAMRAGMYRWMPESWALEAWTLPTNAQLDAIEKLAETAPRGSIMIEAHDGKRHYAKEYEAWQAEDAWKDLLKFYRAGEKPKRKRTKTSTPRRQAKGRVITWGSEENGYQSLRILASDADIALGIKTEIKKTSNRFAAETAAYENLYRDPDYYRKMKNPTRKARAKQARDATYLPLKTVASWEADAAARGVSEVARGPRGFLTAYKRAGSASKLSDAWRRKRSAFVSRHMAQVKANDESLFDPNGKPSRRHLALIMWAYSPVASKLKKPNPTRKERAKVAASKTGKQIKKGAKTAARAVVGAAKGAVAGARSASRETNPTQLRKGTILMDASKHAMGFQPTLAEVVVESKGGRVKLEPLHPEWFKDAPGKGRPFAFDRKVVLGSSRIMTEADIERFRGDGAREAADALLENAKEYDTQERHARDTGGSKELIEMYANAAAKSRMKAKEIMAMYGKNTTKKAATKKVVKKARTRAAKKNPTKAKATKATKSPTKPMGVPKVAIEYIVGGLHVGTPDEEVRKLVEDRARKAKGSTEKLVKACGDYAVKVHRKNRDLYNQVMSGRIGTRRKTRKNPTKRVAKKAPAKRPANNMLAEMRELLARKGYDPKDAAKLHAEGMGPEELAQRLRNKPGAVGSLEHSHRLKRVAKKAPAKRSKNPTKSERFTRKATTGMVRSYIRDGGVVFGETVTGKPLSVGPYHKATAKRPQWAIFMGNVPVEIMSASDAAAHFMALAKPASIKYRNPAKKASTRRVAKKATAKKSTKRVVKKVAKKAPARKVKKATKRTRVVSRRLKSAPKRTEALKAVRAAWVTQYKSAYTGGKASEAKVIKISNRLCDTMGKALDAGATYKQIDAAMDAALKEARSKAKLRSKNPNTAKLPPGEMSWSEADVKRAVTNAKKRASVIKAISFERYNGGVKIKRLFGSSTVTKFYVSINGDPQSQRIVEGYGKTPGERKTYAKRVYEMQMFDRVSAAVRSASKSPAKKRASNPSKDVLHIATKNGKYYVLLVNDWIQVSEKFAKSALKGSAKKVQWSHGKLAHHKVGKLVDDKTLGLMLHRWHSGQNDPIYAAGSTLFAMHKTSQASMARALSEIRRLRSKYPRDPDLKLIENNLAHRVGVRKAASAAVGAKPKGKQSHLKSNPVKSKVKTPRKPKARKPTRHLTAKRADERAQFAEVGEHYGVQIRRSGNQVLVTDPDEARTVHKYPSFKAACDALHEEAVATMQDWDDEGSVGTKRQKRPAKKLIKSARKPKRLSRRPKKNPVNRGSWAKVREALLSVPNPPTNYGLTVKDVELIGKYADWEGRWVESGWAPGTKEYKSLPAMIKAQPKSFLADISEYYGDDYYPKCNCAKKARKNPTGKNLKVGDKVAYSDGNLRYDPQYQGVVESINKNMAMVRWAHGKTTPESLSNLVRRSSNPAKKATTKAARKPKARSVPKEKIQAVKIELHRQEGREDKAEVSAPNVWLKANQTLARWAATAPAGGAHDRTDFVVTFADGEKYKGRYDLNAKDMMAANLGEHIRKYVSTVAGRYNPGNTTTAQYKEWLKGLGVDQKAYGRFLDSYQLG